MDLELREYGNGGDLRLKGNDLALVQGYENMPYMAMFSGAGWWGNDLLLSADPSTRFESQTEQVLQEVVLNSAGRISIEQAIRADLAFLEEKIPGTKVQINTALVSADRLDININIGGQLFRYSWNPETGLTV